VTELVSVHCRVLGTHVSLVTDFEGQVLTIICPEYESATRGCRIKRLSSGGGPLSALLERVAEGAPAARSTTCDVHP
jgi:hypothetical protein